VEKKRSLTVEAYEVPILTTGGEKNKVPFSGPLIDMKDQGIVHRLGAQ